MNPVKKIARLAGLGYLLIFICGFYANFYVLEALLVPGDAAATYAQVRDNLPQFRLGIVAFLIMIVMDVLMAYPLYRLLKPVNASLALFSAWLRIVNGAIFAVAIASLFDVLQINSMAPYLIVHEESVLQAQLMIHLSTFNYTWLIGLVFFGLHLLVLGYLILKAGYLPKVLGFLIALAGVAYLVDSFAQFLLEDYSHYKSIFEMIVIIPSVVGELSFTLWLLIKGISGYPKQKIKPQASPAAF
jgi:hypothetical protein